MNESSSSVNSQQLYNQRNDSNFQQNYNQNLYSREGYQQSGYNQQNYRQDTKPMSPKSDYNITSAEIPIKASPIVIDYQKSLDPG